jgi:hypothetical protein
VPCDACHRSGAAQPARQPGRPALLATRRGGDFRFRLVAGSCTDCHRDPHRGETARAAPAGCTACHRVDGWRQVRFDHAATGTRLDGAHLEVGCTGCHPAVAAGTAEERLRFAETPGSCDGCHADPHRGQLAAADASPQCARCHSSADWHRVRFDHDREARFALEGAHRKLPCTACHRPASPGGPVVFKPLPLTCAGCHPAETFARPRPGSSPTS